MHVDITTDPGPDYGDSMFWPGNWEEIAKARGATAPWYTCPPPAEGLVDVVMDLDRERFKHLFVDLMTGPIRKS